MKVARLLCPQLLLQTAPPGRAGAVLRRTWLCPPFHQPVMSTPSDALTTSASSSSNSSSSSFSAPQHKRKPQQQPAKHKPTTAASKQPPPPTPPTYDYPSLHLVDIGANLTDDMYSGHYHNTPKHQPDLPAVLARASQYGVSAVIVTAGTFDECKTACELIQQHEQRQQQQQQQPPLRLYTTCGIHPTRTKRFASLPPAKLQQLFTDMAAYISSHREQVVAVGECGYDTDRLAFSSLDAQHTVFHHHITLAQHTHLPLFLHDRAATPHLMPLLTSAQPPMRGVIHSYTGSTTDMLAYVTAGFYIGVNGCSLKTAENISTVAAVPSDRLLLETDAPWCDVKTTHAGYQYVKSRWTEVKPDRLDSVNGGSGSGSGGGGGDGVVLVKGRNEPCKILCVAEVVAAVRGVSVEELAKTVAENTERLFGLSKLHRESGVQQSQGIAADAAT